MKIHCYISDEIPPDSTMWFDVLEEVWINSSRISMNWVKPIQCNISTGRILYLDPCPYISNYYLPDDSNRRHQYDTLCTILNNPNDHDMEENYSCILKAVECAVDKRNITINIFIESIESAFKLSSVNFNNLYSTVDLRPFKKNPSRDDWIKNIDQNMRGFIKNNRIFAGLAYLRDVILSVGYRLGALFGYDNKCIPKEIRKITFYPSNINFTYCNYNFGVDGGILFNKITECLIILLMNIDNVEPLVSLYKNLHEKLTPNLNTDGLVHLIEALLKHGEIELVEISILKLKTMEPHHPIIDTAEKTIRRKRIFNQISKTYNISIGEIQNLSGLEFEQFLESQFVKYGFKVERTKGSGDFGADLILKTTSGTRAAIQAKRYKQKVNLKAVQEVVASLAHYNADFGVVITTSGYFQSAVDLAKTNNVELWDEDKLIQFLSGDFSFSMLNE